MRKRKRKEYILAIKMSRCMQNINRLLLYRNLNDSQLKLNKEKMINYKIVVEVWA